ncbi:MAG: hypothetical protein ACO3B3_06330 [Cyanobium sp.]
MTSTGPESIPAKGSPQKQRGSRILRLAERVILIASLLISAVLIFRDSGIVPAAPMDQHFAETVDLHLRQTQAGWVFQYPSLQNSGGITSSLIAGLYKLIIPTSHETLNWHIRILAMATYLISCHALINKFIANQPIRILAYLIIASSGFQLLQPSSDLFSATLLNLFLLGANGRWPRIWTALFLAAFGLCKVDMILAALILAAFWFWWEQRNGERHAGLTLLYTLGWLFLLLSPGLVLQGANPFEGSRSLIAFLSAYTEFFGYHQFSGPVSQDLSASMESIRINTFGGAESFPAIALKYPSLYLDFVGVSAARSIPNIWNVFKFMLVPIGLVYLNQNKITSNRFLFWAALIAAICVIMPAWLVIYLRLRYAVKIAAPLIIVALAGCLALSQHNQRYRQVAWLCGIGTILWQLYFLDDMAVHSHWK